MGCWATATSQSPKFAESPSSITGKCVSLLNQSSLTAHSDIVTSKLSPFSSSLAFASEPVSASLGRVLSRGAGSNAGNEVIIGQSSGEKSYQTATFIGLKI